MLRWEGGQQVERGGQILVCLEGRGDTEVLRNFPHRIKTLGMFAFNIKAILNKQNLLFRGVSVLWSVSEGRRRKGEG